MADEQPSTETSEVEGDPGPVFTRPERGVAGFWKELWHAPTLVLAAGLLLSGMVYAFATAPKPMLGPVMDRIERMVELRRFDDAIELLNTEIRPHLDNEDVAALLSRRYHLAAARAVFGGQLERGLDHEPNHRAILGNYLEAERLDAVLGGQDQYAIAFTYLALGMRDVAMARAAEIPPTHRERRVEIQKRLVDEWLGLPGPMIEPAMEVLTSMLTDPETTVNDRAWALSRQSRVRIDGGYPNEAITRLLRAMPRLAGADPDLLGEIHQLMGLAYIELGAHDQGRRQLARSLELLLPTDDRRAEAMLGLARLDASNDEPERARDWLERLLERHGQSAAAIEASLLLAEILSALGVPDESMGVYGGVVARYAESPEPTRPARDSVAESLLDRYREYVEGGEIERALGFVEYASDLYRIENTPAAVLDAVSDAHERAALALVGGDGSRLDRISELDPSVGAEIRRHLIKAASFRRLHAEKFVLSDNAVYADSLWRAADTFDKAGDRREAIEAFSLYADGVPGDARNAEARYRLGLAFQSLGEFGGAATNFEALIEEQRAGVSAEVGLFADRSHVPLAQVYMADGNPENDAESERLLLRAISGEFGDAQANQFRDALIELGRLYYQTARYEEAIERLDEAAQRYPEDSRGLLVRYRLADAYRRSADEIEARYTRDAMPESVRRELELLAEDRREIASEGFAEVIDAYSRLDARRLGPLERVHQRNAYFYVADCAFELGRYTQAIGLYDRARQNYPNDPASLVALIQVVNAHLEMGDENRARGANERARRFYEALPAEAWDDPDLPMDRADWERWLDSASNLYTSAG